MYHKEFKMINNDLILTSNNIFTATDEPCFAGYVILSGNKISTIGKGKCPGELFNAHTQVIDLGNRTICPGFIDVHCFFSGYVMRFVGKDLSICKDVKQVFELLDKAEDEVIFAHDLTIDISKEELDEKYPDAAVVLFKEGCESCAMNTAAIDKFSFTPDCCYPEAYVKIFPYVIGNKEFIRPQFIEYMKMMNSRGITSIKEMGFDDYYGFTETLNDLEDNKELSLRVNFMSQPVDKDIDFTYGQNMREKFNSDFVTFSGYNQMTDGSVSEYNADLKYPYENKDFCCLQKIDWAKLEKDTIEADKRGFRFSLHAQGDAAIAKVLDIYEKCQRDEKGKMVLRQAITDLEFSDPVDLERMGKMGVIAEIYPQIQSLADREDKLRMIKEKIGDRGRYYWNRRKMADSGVIISCGTDLPLLIDDIPESVYHAVGGYFSDGGEPFNKENTLKTEELLKAWTYGGAYNLGKEDSLGSLEVGKKADIAILSGNIFDTDIKDVKDLDVYMTIVDGKIVYKGE